MINSSRGSGKVNKVTTHIISFLEKGQGVFIATNNKKALNSYLPELKSYFGDKLTVDDRNNKSGKYCGSLLQLQKS